MINNNNDNNINIKPFGWKRNIDYLKINFWLMWKSLIEYKVNMWVSIIEQVVFMISYVFFFYTVSDNFGSTIGWEFIDFLLLGIFIDFVYVFVGFFHWKDGLPKYIQTGQLNTFLSRPIYGFYGYLFSNMINIALIMIIIDVIALPITFIVFDVVIYNVLLSFMIFILIVIFHFSMRTFVSSLAFISYGFNEFMYKVYGDVNNVGKSYPTQFFGKSKLYFFVSFFPLFFVSSLFIPMLRNYEILNIELQLMILVSLTVFSLSGSFIIWHYGLKKYEAFG